MVSVLRPTLVLCSILVATGTWAGTATPESSIDAAIAQANAMVRLGMPQAEVEHWLLEQVQGVGSASRTAASVTVQTPPPSWNVYAVAAWKQQEGSAESQRENVYIRARLDTSQADEGLSDGQPEEAGVDQRGTQAADALHPQASPQRANHVRSGVGRSDRQ